MGMRYDERTSLVVGKVYDIAEIARAEKLEDETDEIF